MPHKAKYCLVIGMPFDHNIASAIRRIPDGINQYHENRAGTCHRSDQGMAEEDEKFVPVIVKRSDEMRRHPDDTLEQAVKEGLARCNGAAFPCAVSMAGGLILGFTAMAVGVLTKLAEPYDSMVITRILTAFVYPLGFVICILSGAQLFTEHTALAVYPVLDKKASLSQLLRLWLFVIVGNLIGAAIIAAMLMVAEPVIDAGQGYVIVGRHLVAYHLLPLLVSAMLAGWLMARVAWLVLGTPATSGQILFVYIVTFLIGVGGLHHSIAGAVEILTALLVGNEFTLGQAAQFIGVALLGNLIGGSIFVAILNYIHIRKPRPSPRDEYLATDAMLPFHRYGAETQMKKIKPAGGTPVATLIAIGAGRLWPC